LRSRLEFEVIGSGREELKRRALQVVSEYVKIDNLEDVDLITDLEMSVKAEIAVDETGAHQINYFIAKVWAKVK